MSIFIKGCPTPPPKKRADVKLERFQRSVVATKNLRKTLTPSWEIKTTQLIYSTNTVLYCSNKVISNCISNFNGETSQLWLFDCSSAVNLLQFDYCRISKSEGEHIHPPIINLTKLNLQLKLQLSWKLKLALISFSRTTHPTNHPYRKSLKDNSELAQPSPQLQIYSVERFWSVNLVFSTPNPPLKESLESTQNNLNKV